MQCGPLSSALRCCSGVGRPSSCPWRDRGRPPRGAPACAVPDRLVSRRFSQDRRFHLAGFRSGGGVRVRDFAPILPVHLHLSPVGPRDPAHSPGRGIQREGRSTPGRSSGHSADAVKDGIPVMGDIDLRYPYLVAVISAGSANMRTPWFFAAVLLLLGSWLWPLRSRRYSPAVWAGLLAVAALVAFGGQLGLNRLQLYIYDNMPRWFAGRWTGRTCTAR